MATDALLALGLLLTTASQLRLGDSPVGFGELFLVLWLGATTIRCLMLRHVTVGPALFRLLIFWGLFAISLSVGTIVALLTGEQFDPTWFLHDTFAYPLLLLVSCASAIEPGAQERLRRVAWLFTTIGGVCLAVLIAGAAGLVRLPFDLWFWERFRGWSQNPNQLSLLCCILALVSLHLADIAASRASRTVALLCMAVAVIVGRMTQSDTFNYALVLAIPVFAFVKLRSWTATPGTRSLAAALALIAVPAVIVSLAPLTLNASSDAGAVVSALSKGGGKEAGQEADLRIALWTQALERGLDTGLLGLGPGPHLQIPPEVVVSHTEGEQPGEVSHPAQNDAANFEAHNTFLDVLTQGGIVGAGALLWLMVEAARGAIRVRSAGLIALLCGVGVSCMTGNIIRLPIVWFALVLCLLADRPAFGTFGSRGIE